MTTKKTYLYFTIITTILFICLFASVAKLAESLNKERSNINQETEYIYVYDSSTDTSADTVTEENKWIIKEYNGVIGIFNSDGELFQVIETYIKTLPGKDQALLKEGMEVNSKEELYSIIEAYSD